MDTTTTQDMCLGAPKRPRSSPGSNVDPRTDQNMLYAITRHRGHRQPSEHNSRTRAPQPATNTGACVAQLYLCSELHQDLQGGLLGSTWRADGDLRWVANRVSTTGSSWHAGIGMCMRADGQTCSRAAALAVQVDPPSPAARPGPIHGMGRAARCRAHALTGPASAEAQHRG